MAQHSYLREYDEALDRSEDRQCWRGEERGRGPRRAAANGPTASKDGEASSAILALATPIICLVSATVRADFAAAAIGTTTTSAQW